MINVNIVVIGGGTGAPKSIQASLALGADTSAVVAMADDGGSSGLIRSSTGQLPPGDVRKCLIAMADDAKAGWAQAFSYRFDYINGHALGNLILSALTDVAGSLPKAIERCETLLGCRGHVYPSTLDSIILCGHTRDGRDINGQADICASSTAIDSVSIKPDAAAYAPAVNAILNADVILLGPGSLFTSIIPNLLVRGITRAIRESGAIVIFVAPLADAQGETWGFSYAETLESLLSYGLDGALSAMLINNPGRKEACGTATGVFKAVSGQDDYTSKLYNKPENIAIRDSDIDRICSHGVRPVLANLCDARHPSSHDVGLLAAGIDDIISSVRAGGV
ncbi:MAG: YvcK family protein [Coriobacteriales bacterium]|jgi:uncharacterized cofD-like protein|nr:YvcK family protein [Coriobacteriales bacterium]